MGTHLPCTQEYGVRLPDGPPNTAAVALAEERFLGKEEVAGSNPVSSTKRINMVAKNDITGDSIQTRGATKPYRENIEKIFGDKSEEKERKAREKAEYFARLAAETKEKLSN